MNAVAICCAMRWRRTQTQAFAELCKTSKSFDEVRKCIVSEQICQTAHLLTQLLALSDYASQPLLKRLPHVGYAFTGPSEETTYTPRKLLTALLLLSEPDDLLHGTPEAEQKILMEAATRFRAAVTRFLTTLLECGVGTAMWFKPFLRLHAAVFTHVLSFWSVTDKRRFMHMTGTQIKEMDTLIAVVESDVEKERTRDGFSTANKQTQQAERELTEFRAQRERLVRVLKSLAGSEGEYDAVMATCSPPVNIDEVTRTAKKAFWDILLDSLKEGDTSRLSVLLEELQSVILETIPSSQDQEIENLHAALDVPFICQQVQHGVYTAENFQRLSTYLGNLLVRMGPPSEDEFVHQWMETFHTDLRNIQKGPVPWYHLIPVMLEFYLECYGKLANFLQQCKEQIRKKQK